MTKSSTMTVAVIQLCSGQDRRRNLDQAESLMSAAVARGATLLALPENLTYIGEDEGEKLAHAESVDDGEGVLFLRTFAARHRVTVVGGSLPIKGSAAGMVTNTCLVFNESGQIARYDKVHLFDAEIDGRNTFQESRLVEPGSGLTTFRMEGQTMGLSICYDLRFPELYRALASRGARVLFVPSAFTRETGRDHWEVLLRARAIENLCYVVAPAQSGDHGGGRASYGRSMVVGPWGQIIAQCQDGEGFALAELDFGQIDAARKRLPGTGRIVIRTIG